LPLVASAVWLIAFSKSDALIKKARSDSLFRRNWSIGRPNVNARESRPEVIHRVAELAQLRHSHIQPTKCDLRSEDCDQHDIDCLIGTDHHRQSTVSMKNLSTEGDAMVPSRQWSGSWQ
jgi:hypothetical protein